MSRKNSAYFKKLHEKTYNHTCKRCGRTNLWWLCSPKINDWKWYLTGKGDEGLPHACKK